MLKIPQPNATKNHSKTQPITYASPGLYTKQICFLMTLFAVMISQ